MNSDEFEALLAKRDECQVSHDLACQILAEEGENALTRHTCMRTYFELEDVEQQIAAECAAERAEAMPSAISFEDLSWAGPAGDAWIASGGTKD